MGKRPPRLDRELPAAWTAIRARTFVAWAIGLVAVVALVGVGLQQIDGRPAGPPGPTEEGRSLMERIDELALSSDCDGLQGELNDARSSLGPPGTVEHSRRATVMRYAEDAMVQIECQIRAPLEIDNGGSLAGSARSAYF